MLFFGTPHRGANLANVAVHLENLVRALQLKGSRQYIKDLATYSTLIEGMNEDFKHHLNRLMIHSFYEERPTSSIGNVVCDTLFISRDGALLMAGCYLQVVVPLASAVISAPTETYCGISGDHISMCKYTSEASPQYQVAARNISKMVSVIRNIAQSAVSESTPSLPRELEVALARLRSGVSTTTHGSGPVIVTNFGDVKGASIWGVGNYGGIHPSLSLFILILCLIYQFRPI